MFIIDYFRKISTMDIFREVSEIIRTYYMRSHFKRDERNNYKSFYLEGFDNDDFFIAIDYMPYGGENVPSTIHLAQGVDVVHGYEGLMAKPKELVKIFVFYQTYRLSEWKKIKRDLIGAIEYAIQSKADMDVQLAEWIEEKKDPKTIVLEHNPPGFQKPVKKYKRKFNKESNHA